jgi:hypothetical protein
MDGGEVALLFLAGYSGFFSKSTEVITAQTAAPPTILLEPILGRMRRSRWI